MNIIALIPARGGSKGIKNKNIMNVMGKPLIYYTIDIAKKIKNINEVYVSTDSKKIKKISEKYGANVPFLRPKKYSSDNSSDLGVFQHFYNWYLQNKKKKIDLIIHLRATTPFRKANTIVKAIKIISKDKKTSCLRSFTKSSFSPFKMWLSNNNIATPIFKKKINGNEMHSLGRQQLPQGYCHVGYIDILRPNLTVSENSMVGKKTNLFLIDPEKENYVDIDTKNDLKKLSKIIYKLKKRKI